MTSLNIHTCSSHEKIGQNQPVSNFCTCLINPYCSYGVLTVFGHCFWSLTSVYVPNRDAKTAAHISRDFLTNQNIVTLPGPARSRDLVPIEHVWDGSPEVVKM